MPRFPHVEKRLNRFLLVGVVNTAFNFAILNLSFYEFKTSRVVSSIIATGCVAVVSFYLNHNFVFQHKEHSWRQPVYFLAVMLSGTMLIHNSIFALSSWIISKHTEGLLGFIGLFGLHVSGNFMNINVSNIIGSLSSRLWNYNGYRLLVFKDRKEKTPEVLE